MWIYFVWQDGSVMLDTTDKAHAMMYKEMGFKVTKKAMR